MKRIDYNKTPGLRIFGWMLNLGLSKSELLTFALIDSYTRNKKSYTGSLIHLSSVTGVSKTTAEENLKSLAEKGYIIKHSIKANGIKQTSYTSTKTETDITAVNEQFYVKNYDSFFVRYALFNSNLSLTEALVYSYLESYFSMKELVFKKNIEALVEWTGLCDRTIERTIKSLIDKKILSEHDNYLFIDRYIEAENKLSFVIELISKLEAKLEEIALSTIQIDSEIINDNSCDITCHNNKETKVITDNIEHRTNIQDSNSSTCSTVVRNIDYDGFMLSKDESMAYETLLMMIYKNKLKADKLSLQRYFKRKIKENWLDKSGNKIKNIVGYVINAFEMKSDEDEFFINMYKEGNYLKVFDEPCDTMSANLIKFYKKMAGCDRISFERITPEEVSAYKAPVFTEEMQLELDRILSDREHFGITI